jgi:glycosyltransferase involved in cell wall biosynthesis
MRILIISDAWHPQINGVVRSLEATTRHLRQMGHEVEVIGPKNSWRTIAAPSYPSIKLEFFARPRLRHILTSFKPDFIHIATEGPLGWASRNLCLQLQKPFTTSYHTRFPEYLAARIPAVFQKPVFHLAYAAIRRFHAPSSAVMVATNSIQTELRQHKLHRLVRWSRGVDTNLYRLHGKNLPAYAKLPRPLLLYVGRVAVEKNLEAFLKAKTPGTKIVIGDGPDTKALKNKYPSAHFLGTIENENLARHYAAADIFVFPSTTDTFGLVLLEAAASGLRIASYPAPGPADIFENPVTRSFAVLDIDLEKAINTALILPDDPQSPRHFAETFSWETCTRQFFEHLQAQTPQAIKRITRMRNWLSRWWQRALALAFK